MAAAAAAGLITPQGHAQLAAAPLFALPGVAPPGYAFHLPLLVPFLIAALAGGLRTIGVVTTCQQINDADWQKPEIKSIMGGVLADGLSCAVSGALGATGLSTSPSAVGASQASGATSRYVALAMGAWFALLACFPKLLAVFLAFPPAVVGGALVFTGSIMLAGGMHMAAAGGQDTRKTFIIGIAILLGLSQKMFPEYFQGLPHWLHLLTGSMLSTATIAAVALNLLFRLGISRTESISVPLDEESWGKVDALVRLQGSKWGAGTYAMDRLSAAGKDVLTALRTRGWPMAR
jgi:xanthine permease XanP